MKTIGIVFLILAVICSFVIWSFSAKSAANSTVDSEAARTALEDLLEKLFGEDFDIDEFFVRKLAHFCEFAGLGFLVYMAFYFFNYRRIKLFGFTSAWGLIVAIADEILQLFYEGRSAQMSDVFLDMSGVVSAFLVLSVFFALTNKKSRG